VFYITSIITYKVSRCMTSIEDVKTFSDKKIDHCFASPFLVSKNLGYGNLTDHKILDIKIS